MTEPNATAGSAGCAGDDRTEGLAEILAAAARGTFPYPDGSLRVLPAPDPDQAAVVAFSGHTLVVADVDQVWVDSLVSDGDLSAPLSLPFLSALGQRLGRKVHTTDMVLTASAAEGDPPLRLTEITDASDPAWQHPRVRSAGHRRRDLRVFTVPGAVLILGRGLAGRLEMSYEVTPAAREQGLGRALAASARYLALPDETLWAQCAPGNAGSVRVLLAAGYLPAGAEALLLPPTLPEPPSHAVR